MSKSSNENDEEHNLPGFKFFKLSPSNYRSWKGSDDADYDAYIQEMALLNDPLIDNWKVEDVIYEIAIKEGYSLNCRVELLQNIASNNAVYQVTDFEKEQAFKICLDKHD